MAPTVKTHLSVLAQKIQTLLPGEKGVGDREILEIYLNSAFKNTLGTDIFPHGTKSLLTGVTDGLKYVTVQSASCVASLLSSFILNRN